MNFLKDTVKALGYQSELWTDVKMVYSYRWSFWCLYCMCLWISSELPELSNNKDLLKKIVYNTNNRTCMLRSCGQCPTLDSLIYLAYLLELFDIHEIENLFYYYWQRDTKFCTMLQLNSTISDFGVSMAILNPADIFYRWYNLNFELSWGHVKSINFTVIFSERIDVWGLFLFFIHISWNNWLGMTLDNPQRYWFGFTF